MNDLETDIEALDNALQLFFRAMKRPQRWTAVTDRAGINIDRPAAVILHMLVLAHPRHLRVQDVADQLGIEAPSVTRKTQELEQAGYLRRLPDEADRRAIGLQVTPKGRGVSNRLWKAQREIFSQALADWPANERRQFIKLFERFSQDITNNQSATTKRKQEIS